MTPNLRLKPKKSPWLILLVLLAPAVWSQEPVRELPISERMVGLLSRSTEHLDEDFAYIETHWQRAWTPMVIELMYLSGDRDTAQRLRDLLYKKTRQRHGFNFNDWLVWWWKQERAVDPDYADFKSRLYRLIDRRFEGYFSNERVARIRLDAVVWGGVAQDGIPPLRQPEMIGAKQATFLEDDNVIFGIALNGDVRAYPKRIMAWHEMFVDEIGGTEYAGVYCTLCGAMILYETHFDGVRHELGTSGFLYLSNKLMYDKATQTLWSSTWGEPVIGPLVDQGIRLKRSHLVTTTWGEWRRRHPETKVLSTRTGYGQDYSEGAAYREYFATDELMFQVPTRDRRLKNKAEVLALTFPDITEDTMALSAKFLKKNSLYVDQLGAQRFVVLTDRSGANRVYEAADVEFVEYDRDSSITDSEGNVWALTEGALSFTDQTLARLPAHRAFWFGWHAAHPDTELVK